MLFDWLYPAHFPTIVSCLDAWADTPAVTTPLLKFMSEFVHNRTQRLTFDSSSPNGILLFREVSRVLVTYGMSAVAVALCAQVDPMRKRTTLACAGRYALQLPTSPPDPYNTKYKGVWLCLQILTRALSGNYVNFGVFDLYGDPALKVRLTMRMFVKCGATKPAIDLPTPIQDALDMALKMALSIPLADILAYRKVAKAYFMLLDVLCHNHAAVIAARDTTTFAFVMTSLDAGLKSLDVAVSSQCATALDNLAGFFFKNMQNNGEAPSPSAQVIFVYAQPRALCMPS